MLLVVVVMMILSARGYFVRAYVRAPVCHALLQQGPGTLNSGL
jgi:hypothetical protein